MSLILALGSNLGHRRRYLSYAKELLGKQLTLIKEGTILETRPVDYLSQPYFLNQLVEYEIPKSFSTPQDLLRYTQNIEQTIGRMKSIDKGPRTIDIDILFYGTHRLTSDQLTIPHPAWYQRPFILGPLRDLPYYETLKKIYPQYLS
jgi:2-amino-4-hydroxy-6-hydroxymethyldihydropteridine diphosphokinase